MLKVLLTTLFRALIIVIAWFYMKFMDQELWSMVSNWIMNQEVINLDWTQSTNPINEILSGVTVMQQQLIEWFDGLNLKLDETKSLLQWDWWEVSVQEISTGSVQNDIVAGTWS